jgi:crotonobetainyl-CoA:carnitine CoA-transferase CaiB-like acyl-CoA transferase
MKSEDGRQVVQALCAQADVVHHNFRPGVATRLGIDYDSLHAERPDVIVLEASAYGDDGPRSALPGFDMVFQACSGLDSRAGAPGTPFCQRYPVVDFTAGLLGSVAVMMALVARAERRTGADVRMNLLNTSLFLLSELVQLDDGSFAGVTPINDELTGTHPTERLYRAADGWIAIAARSDPMAQRLVSALGLDFGGEHRSRWGPNRAEAISHKLGEMTAATALTRLADADVWAEFCQPDGWARLKGDHALCEQGAVVEGPAPPYGRARQVGQPFTFTHHCIDDDIRGLVDELGGHTRAILSEHGFADDEADRLFSCGAVR